MRAAFEATLALGPAERTRLVGALAAAARASTSGRFAAERRWTALLAERHPDDAGVACALLLRHLALAPGDAIFLPAGNLHAYLGGVGIEIMASSDNVLRGGLTPKHVDVAELLRVLDFAAPEVPLLRPQRAGIELIYETPAREFRLSRLDVTPGARFDAEPWGPEIVLCTSGTLGATRGGKRLELRRGASAFAAFAGGGYSLSGSGVAFRACVAA